MSLLTLLRTRKKKGSLFDSFSRLPSNTYFNHLNPTYNNERLLYDLLLTEAYNKHGVCSSYIITSYNLMYDRIFKEDNNRRFERRFKFMSYFDLPKETRNFSNAGIGWLDVFHIYISKRHFNVASKIDYTTNQQVYNSYIPRVGDLLETEYNNVFYEIISVKDQEEQFLQHQHSWDLVVKVMRDKSFSFNTSTSATMQDLSQYVDKTDIFDIGNFINQNKETVEYKPELTECDPNDPFNNWWDG